MAKEDKKKDPGMVAKFFGGMLGSTAKKVDERKAANEKAKRMADGEDDYAPARGEGRPEQSKKWKDE